MQGGDNETIRSSSTKNVQIVPVFNYEKFIVILYGVLHVPIIMYNLISVSGLRRNNSRIVVNNAGGDSRRGILTMENKDSLQSKIMTHEKDVGSL